MRCSRTIRVIALLALSTALCTAAYPQNGRSRRRATPRVIAEKTISSSGAVQALFLQSDLPRAKRLATDILAAPIPGPEAEQARIDALFVTMEVAALQGDVPAQLDAAVRLCELRAVDGDPRVAIAAARLLDNAGNNKHFRAVVPRIRAIVAAGSAQSSFLRAALLTAAKDGLPGLSVAELAQASGLITDWSVVGPFGKYSNISFDEIWPPEQDAARSYSYDGRRVEHFRFEDGTFELADYLSSKGVLYAAADVLVASAGGYRVRVESPGTLRVFVDHRQVIDKDDRLRTTSEVAAAVVNLGPGRHRVLVKFISKAAPFRLALLAPAKARPSALQAITSPAEAAYVSAARDYWNGDYNGAIAQLVEMRGKQPSAAVNMLLAAAWGHVDESSSQSAILAREALKLAPSCIQAEMILADSAVAQQRWEEAEERAQRILESRGDFEPALRVMATSAPHLDSPSDAAAAYQLLTNLHPSCSVLQEASTLATTLSDFGRARALQSRLSECAPGSLAWADALSKSGDHTSAADALKRAVRTNPLDRSAREFLVRELAFAHRFPDALLEGDELVRMAPGSASYRAMNEALRRGELPVATDSVMVGFAGARQFYSRYRRDAFTVLNETANRHFSGGPAVVLLHDRVAQFTADGGVNLYVHKITRVLNRDGILQYGEVSVPAGASVLALRTMKPDGSVAEPEMNQHKATVSMPTLTAGDAIDLEYIVRYPEGDVNDHADAFEFTFGSFAAPILFSRFVVLSPGDSRLQFVPSSDVPSVRMREEDGQVAREWERNNIAQSVSEISMPRAGLLPSIRVFAEAPAGWTSIRDQYRDMLIDAVRIGNNVETAAASIGGGTDDHKMRAAYRFVITKVRQSSTLFNSSAERTLSAYSGNRTAALIAIARALGLNVDLVMARDAALPKIEAASPHVYTHPLVLFYPRERSGVGRVLIDAETEGIGFGGIAPTIQREDALLMSVQRSDGLDVRVALPAPILEDRSSALADVSLDRDGNLAATLEIRMGAARSAQMRAILSGIEEVNRKHFFEQLATRIFPGATDASGEVRNESEPDHLLELVVRCRAPRFLKLDDRTAELDQLAPALGLRKMYATTGPRREPLLIDTPLIETATFRIQIPEDMRFATVPAAMTEQNAFGSYAVRFSAKSANVMEVERDFRVPVQVIQPENFDAFSRFARRIDDAERQRFTLERSPQVSTNTWH